MKKEEKSTLPVITVDIALPNSFRITYLYIIINWYFNPHLFVLVNKLARRRTETCQCCEQISVVDFSYDVENQEKKSTTK